MKIDVDYDEYKKTIAENMKLIAENHSLKELCKKYEEEHKTTFEEWKKDINIINELEKWLEKQIEISCGVEDLCYADVLEELQELKGNDKV